MHRSTHRIGEILDRAPLETIHILNRGKIRLRPSGVAMNQIIGVSPEARIKSIEINFDTVFTAQFNEWIGEHLAGNLHLEGLYLLIANVGEVSHLSVQRY